MIFKTKQFILRPIKMSDAADYAKYANDRVICRNMLRWHLPFTIKEAQKRCRLILERCQQRILYNWAIEINGEFVGWVSLGPIEKKHKAGLGYWLARKYWGNGLMTKIVKIVTAYGLNKLQLKRIEAHVFPFNSASARVLKKCGYQEEGRLRKYYLKDGKYLDALVLAKIK